MISVFQNRNAKIHILIDWAKKSLVVARFLIPKLKLRLR